jgi:ribosomal protein S18 acetylase RimI-like enzyme
LLFVQGALMISAGSPPLAGFEPATLDDVPALANLYGAGRLKIQRTRRRRRLQRRFERGDDCFVVRDNNRAIEAAVFITSMPFRLDHYRIPVRPGPEQLYFYGVHVDQSARRRGIGEALLRGMRAAMIERGARHALGHISPRNPATPHLILEKLGYQILARDTVVVLLNRFGVPIRHSVEQRSAVVS